MPATTHPTTEIGGYVNDTTFRPLSNARVDVPDGPQPGSTATTDASGRFSITGEFTGATRFRASKDGYQAAILTIQSPSTPFQPQSPSLTFFLSVAGASGNQATLIVEADPACSGLPSDLRTRTYPATVTTASSSLPANTAFNAVLSGSSLDSYFHVVFIRVDGDQVALDLSDNGIEEEVAPETYYFVGGYGSSATQAGATTISAPFSGVVDYCVVKSDPGTAYPCSDQAIARVRCSSVNHRIVLAWR